MQIVVLAGGRGTRLMPLTKDTPKSMIPIMGKPFIEYQLELFRRNGITNVVLCAGYLAEKIMDHLGDGGRFKVSVSYSLETNRLLGTAGALKKAEPLLEDFFFLTYGDSYLRLDYREVMERLRSSDKVGVMVVYWNFDRFDKSNAVVEGGFMTAYDKMKVTPEMVYIDYGLSAFRKEALSLIPPDTVMDLQSFYKALIDKRQLLAYEARQRFHEIGSPSGLKEFQEVIASVGVE